MGIILYIAACLLYPPLTLWNYFLVENKKGYFISSARSIDVLANREFRTLWNRKLRTEKGYKFGIENETISSALGKNQRDKTLTSSGKKLVFVLNFFDKNHCLNAITENPLN